MILIKDNCLHPEQLEFIRNDALASGFGTWKPGSDATASGYPETDGMNWQGKHAPLNVVLYNMMKQAIFPNHQFFKVSTKNDNPSLIHSDRHDGDYTAIFYMSDHDFVSGTAFYRHKDTGLLEMPCLESVKEDGTFEQWNQDTKDYSKWEQLDFVRGIKNRMVIFSAPQFHSRIPLISSGETYEEGRMVWVNHFVAEEDLR